MPTNAHTAGPGTHSTCATKPRAASSNQRSRRKSAKIKGLNKVAVGFVGSDSGILQSKLIPDSGKLQDSSCEPDSGKLQVSPTVQTPINVPLLKKLLHGFPKADTVVDGFTRGFRFHFCGHECPVTSRNSLLANTHSTAVDEKLQRELDLERIAGPFEEVPFDNFKCSPLSLREKSEPGKYRLLHNLSYPYDSTSVNGGIEQHHKTVSYASVQTAIKMINSIGQGCFMAKADIESAYRIVPIHPSQFHLLGFKWRGKYYYDKYLPMGMAESCSIFELISDAFVYIMKNFHIAHIVKVLDDFLLMAPTMVDCNLALEKFKFICGELNIPLVSSKTSTVAEQQIVFLGVYLDTSAMIARLPDEKLKRYAGDIDLFLENKSTKLRALQSLIGKLQFATSVIPVGKPFLRRLIDGTKGLSWNMEVPITHGMKLDLHMWQIFLREYNGVSVIRTQPPCDSTVLNLFSDASDLGYGGSFGAQWIQGKWNRTWRKLNIAVRELYPIVALMKMFGHLCKNHAVTFQCDNQAIVAVINKQTSKSPTIMTLLRPFVLTLMTNNIKFNACYIRSEDNILADALSRFQEDAELLSSYGMMDSPTPVPQNLLPQEMIPDNE